MRRLRKKVDQGTGPAVTGPRVRKGERIVSSPPEVKIPVSEQLSQLARKLHSAEARLGVRGKELRKLRVELEELRERHGVLRAALRTSEARFRKLLEHAAAGIVITDGGGNIEQCNPAFCELLESTPKELRATNLVSLIHPDDLADNQRGIRRLLAGEVQAFECEGRLLRRGGGMVWVRRFASLLPGNDGKPERVFVLVIDITGRKTAAEQLRRINATLERRVAEQTREVRLLAEAVSNLAEGVMITGDAQDWPDPVILFVNRAMCGITGYAPEELIGRTPAVLHGEQTSRVTLEQVRAELASGRSCQAEMVHYRENGRPYTAEILITPWFDATGRRTNFVSIHRDITERKRTEDSLTSLGRIVDDSLNEVYIFDADTLRFLQVNRGARENLGYSMDELRVLTPLDLKPAFDRERLAALLRVLRSGREKKVVFEARHRRKDGSVYDVQADVQMTQYRGRACFVEIGLDTTRRRELEQEVINAAEKERQRIAHDLHDELGALLTGIKYRVEAFGATLTGAESKAAAGHAAISKLIGEAISKTRHIARGLHPVGGEAEDLMGALRRLREHVSTTTGLRCRFLCPEPVLVHNPITANHLFRIAQEAVNNAVKHSGASHITIFLQRRDGEIHLAVSDNGRGFDRTATRVGGLGLHIMNYRADAMNGTLRLLRGRTSGTRVVCSVPA